jgi:phosphate transport system permease protein
MLGLGRAIGETMTVLMATGNALAFPEGYLDPVRTITATIAIEMGEVPYQTTHYFALFAIATVLFLITLAVNIAGERIAKHYRKFTA